VRICNSDIFMEQKPNETSREVTKLDSLDGRDLQAIQLRYLGKTSGEIAEVTGFDEGYVRQLFKNGGRLEKAYKDFALKQQNKAQESVDMALNRARQEALQAIERIITLSKDASNEAAIFKANEFLLNVAGIKSEVSLRSFFQNKTYQQAEKLVDELFHDLFGQGLSAKQFQVLIQSHCPKCDPNGGPPKPMLQYGIEESKGDSQDEL